MKLIIQIPCYNEEDYLPQTLADLPAQIEGIDTIEYLIINDGSTDRTVEVAREHGVHHIVSHSMNRGLATAFQSGLTACLQLGADIIVNTDADNQYPGASIPDLVAPIVVGQADMVIGNRQTHKIAHFSPIKRYLQGLGSRVVRFVSRTDVPDAPSGFRAISRSAAMRINVLTHYTYTLETIIQAANRNLVITHIPVTTNPKTRESRLMKSTTAYVLRSARTILQLFLLYQPLRSFTYLALPFFIVGGGLWVRFGVILLLGESERGSNIQSINVGGVLILISILLIVFGLIGELVAFNRRLQEEILFYLKQNRFDGAASSLLEEHPRIQTEQQLDKNPDEAV